MLRHTGIIKRTTVVLITLFTFSSVAAHFQNNIVDPSPLYTPKGLNKFPTVNVDKKNGREVDMINVSLSPYYMTANNGYDANSGGVKNGDIYGYWNFFGFFLGKQGVDNATGDNFTRGNVSGNSAGEIASFSTANTGWTVFTNYPNLQAAYNKLVAIQNGTTGGSSPAPTTPPSLQNFLTDYSYTDSGATGSIHVNANGLFDQKYGQFSVEAAMRRMGVRTEIEYRILNNLRATLRTGFADYRVRPIFNYLGTSNSDTTTTQSALGYLNYNILTAADYNLFFQDVGLSISPYSIAVMEDIHVQLSYDYAFPFKSQKGNIVLNVVPYISVGAWLPVSPQKDISKAFQYPVGTNGLMAATADFGLSLDFADIMTFGFGGGVTITQNQNFRKERVPTSQYQSGFFPWTSQVRRETGTTWYLNASMQCLNFTDGFSFYADITLAEHSADKITINESNTAKATLLKTLNAAGILSGMSAWRSQNYNLGLDLELTPNLTMGFGMQGSLGGVRVWKNITLLGSLRFEF